jgi:hypothetical protein
MPLKKNYDVEPIYLSKDGQDKSIGGEKERGCG